MLKIALQSIFDQTFQDFEIIVVNDAGEDVEHVLKAINSPKISFLQHETNKGLAAARNTGIRAARGKYIAYLDDDDIYYPDHLETLTNFLEETGAKVAYSDACIGFQEKRDDLFVTMHREKFPAQDFDRDSILVDNFIPVLCLVHAKDCLSVTGEFDESLRRHEDWDLWIRMSQSFQFAHIKKITCEFTYRPDGPGMTSSTTPMFLETYRRIYSKYAHLTRDRKDIQARQQTNLFKANIRVYNFLKDKVRQYLHGMPGEQLLNLLVATGATTSQIKSVLDWQNGIASVIPSSQLLEQALLIAPENHPARLDIIAHYIHQGQFKDASKHFTLLRQFNPDQSTIEQLALLLTTEPAKAASLGTQDETEVNKLPSPLKVAVFTLDIPEQACARLRLLDPFATLPGIVEVLWGVTIKDSNYSINLDMITAADVIVVQRFFPRKGTLSYLEQIFNSGKPVMYEIDDLLTDVPDANHLKSWIKETTDLLPEFCIALTP